jgi:steroid 5-alpha reductase family enzyme
MAISTLLLCAGTVGACVCVIWLLSVKMTDASIADIWWGPGFSLIAWVAMLSTDSEPIRAGLVTLVLTLWGLRLAIFMARRNLGHGEDRRYQAMRGDNPHFWWFSLFKVFLLQGALQIAVALPVFAVAHSQASLGLWDGVGITVALTGVLIEAIADHQLTHFKANPDNQGKVMDQGLWGYSRHPNYFGNAVLWAGLGVVGIACGGPWWSLAGPALMLFLLLRVSGVAMLESTIVDRRPGYQQYINEVSAFVPWPRQKPDSQEGI